MKKQILNNFQKIDKYIDNMFQQNTKIYLKNLLMF